VHLSTIRGAKRQALLAVLESAGFSARSTGEELLPYSVELPALPNG
jgi:hypothetical protein